MWILVWIVMIALPVLYGGGILGVLYRRPGEFTLADALITGEIVLIGLAEITHLCGVFLGMSFSRCAALSGGAAILLAIAAVAVWLAKRRAIAGNVSLAQKASEEKKNREEENRKGETEKEKKSVKQPGSGYTWGKAEKIGLTVFGLLALSQVVFIVMGTGIYRQGEMMAETVGSFLHTDGVYLVNPMTGSAYTEGIPARLKILCLPSLYGVLCSIFRQPPGTVVWLVAPLVILVCCYGAFYCVGRCLFPEDGNRQMCFLAVVALLMWVGSYLYGMDGFGLLFSGWRGVTIRNCVLVPWLISLCLRRKWLLVLLCIVAEACMVWTLYGLGVCFLMALVLGVCIWICGRGQKGAADRERGAGR